MSGGSAATAARRTSYTGTQTPSTATQGRVLTAGASEWRNPMSDAIGTAAAVAIAAGTLFGCICLVVQDWKRGSADD